MIGMVKKAYGLIRRFGRNAEAVAAVEFALVLPIMLTLYVGSVELSSAISVDKRVATVSGSLGDLVARANKTINQSTVEDYFKAAASTMAPYSSDSVKQVVSCIHVDNTGNATVEWSVPYNGATAHAANSSFDLSNDTNLKNLSLNNYVIVAEAQLSYTPLFGLFFKNAFSLYHKFYFLPRFGSNIALNTTS